jgi:PhoPQ-activated pathogenicity-related protein
LLLFNSKLNPSIGLAGIYADGGGNGDGPEKIGDQFTGILATRTGILMGHLHEIPNQPAYFTAEKPPRRRVEDALIAYGWSHFINDTTNTEWLPRLPMVKSVIKAMYGYRLFALNLLGMP